ncbi:MAG: precorrin-6A reductase [Lachnospiraceae bacterium]|nr:precorrin-6A reductase [Lachnospiraceae bacterium]
MAETIFLFGGTTEGRLLAEAALGTWNCHVFVATDSGEAFLPRQVRESAAVHTGRLQEAEMAEQMRRQKPVFVLDATHPYAAEASLNIRAACRMASVKYLRVVRESLAEEGSRQAGMPVQRKVKSAEEAARVLAAEYAGQPILLTTGSKELSAFSKLLAENEQVYARILPGEENIALARSAGMPADHILTGVGPFTEEENLEILRKYGIAVLVTKESGGRGGYLEKLRAAKRGGAEVVVICRPVEEQGISLEEALQLLEAGWNER